MKKKSRGQRFAIVGFLAAVAATNVVTVGATGAAAASPGDVMPSSTETTVRAFTVTLPPWHSVKIPQASCPAGMNLVNRDLSPGRIVPRGVEVIEPGGIGVHLNQASFWSYYEDGSEFRVYTGLSGKDITEATNWDPFTSHELTIGLHCTTDLASSSTSEYYVR